MSTTDLPVPRKRGRPRKQQQVLSTPPAKVKIEEELIVSGKRSTRGKKPKKYVDEINEAQKTPIPGHRGRGRPRLIHSHLSLEQQGIDAERLKILKENLKLSNDDVSLKVTVHNKDIHSLLPDIGVYVRYYCRICPFYSTNIGAVTRHLLDGDHIQNPAGPIELNDDATEKIIDDNVDEELANGGYLSSSVTLNVADKKEVPNESAEGEEVIDATTITTAPSGLKVGQHFDAEIIDDEDNDPDYELPSEKVELKEEDVDAELDDTDDEDFEDTTPHKKRRRKDHSHLQRRIPVINESALSGSAARKWFCKWCHYTVLYSQVDFEEHMQCHLEDGESPELGCHRCLSDEGFHKSSESPRLSKKGRKVKPDRIDGPSDWFTIKNHLSSFHGIDFQLQCNLCSEPPFSNHFAYMNHKKMHKLHCKFHRCRQKFDLKSDLAYHELCHDPKDNTKFRCPDCDHRANRDTYWPVMRAHIVTAHPNKLSADYRCSHCNKGFQELRRFMHHQKTCGPDAIKIICEMCGSGIRKHRLLAHARKHMHDEGIHSSQLERIARETHVRNKGLMVVTQEHDGQVILKVGDKEMLVEPGQDELEVAEAMLLVEGTQQNTDQNDQNQEVDVVENSSEQNIRVSSDLLKSVQKSDDSQEDEETEVIENNPEDGKSLSIQLWATNTYMCRRHQLTLEGSERLCVHLMQYHWGLTRREILEAEEKEKREKEEVDRALSQPVESPSLNTKDVNYTDKKCQHCGKSFPSQEELDEHSVTVHKHIKPRMISCRMCGKRFRTMAMLQKHITHAHEKKKIAKVPGLVNKKKMIFVCETCGYTTPEAGRLRNHVMSSHEGRLPFECNICDYKTNERADLRRHRLKHAGVKRHSCQVCSYRTDQRWLLVNHMARHHDIYLPKIKRNTRGASIRGKRRRIASSLVADPKAMNMVPFIDEAVTAEEEVIETDPNQGQVTISYLVPEGYEHAGSTEHGGAVISVEELQEQSRGGEVIYMREDGTVLDADEAAYMVKLLSSGPQSMIKLESESSIEDGQLIEQQVINQSHVDIYAEAIPNQSETFIQEDNGEATVEDSHEGVDLVEHSVVEVTETSQIV